MYQEILVYVENSTVISDFAEIACVVKLML